MKINILVLLIILLANNAFAGEKADTRLHLDSVEKKHAQLLHDFDSYQQKIKNTIVELSNDDSEHTKKINSLEKKYAQLLHDFDSYRQDINNTIVKLSNNDSGHAKKINSLEKKNVQLLHDFDSYRQKINNAIVLLNKKIVTTTESMSINESNHNQLSTRFDKYRQKTDKDINRILQKFNISSASVQKQLSKLKDHTTNINNSIIELHNTARHQKIYLIVVLLLNVLFILIVFFYFKKQLIQQQNIFSTNHNNIRKEDVKLDQKLTDIIETQLRLLKTTPKVAKEAEPDHSLALKVANEIIRIHKNLSRMDKKTKGVKQLSASVKRIQDNFAFNGYELVEMLGEPYKEGMKVQANFIPDDELDDGQEIITRIIKPQVNYKDEMIQSAQIEVSQG